MKKMPLRAEDVMDAFREHEKWHRDEMADKGYKTEYNVGEELDVNGLTVNYSNEYGEVTQVAVTADMVSGFDTSKEGECTVTVTYEGISCTFTVTVVKGEETSSTESENQPESGCFGAVTGVELLSLLAIASILLKRKNRK